MVPTLLTAAIRRALDEARVAAPRGPRLCHVCGGAIAPAAAWGLCTKHYRSRRRTVIKDAAIAAMGGACTRCGGVFHRVVYDFHHVTRKRNSVSLLMLNAAPPRIAAELVKCVLLCANCHRLEHHHDSL